MITGIGLENIKSFKEKQVIELAPFTLLIGDNGSGKSSFIQILSLLVQNPPSMSLADGQFVNQGGFEQLANDQEKPLKIHFTGKISLDAEGYNYLNDLVYNLELNYDDGSNNRPILSRWKIESEDPNNLLKSKLGVEDKTFLETNWNRNVSTNQSMHFYDEIDDISFEAYIPVHLYNFTIQSWSTKINEVQKRRATSLMANLSTKILSDFDNVSYVPALRGIDTRFQRLVEQIPDHPLNPNNFNTQSNLLASSLAYNRDLENKISSLMEAILNRKCRSRLQQGILVSVETFNGERWVNIMNEGFGANPLVHLVYQIVASPKNSIILIEEPEIHLFPAAQKRLIVELIKFAKSENKHLLITTHSPHIYSVLSQFKEMHEKEVKAYFFKRDSNTFASVVEEITAMNREGILKDFLALDLGGVATILEAAGI